MSRRTSSREVPAAPQALTREGDKKRVEYRSSHNFPELGALDCNRSQPADVRDSCSRLAGYESRFARVPG